MFSGKFKFFLAIFGAILFWSLATPLFEFPDEQAHVGTVNFLVQEGRSPRGQELDMTEEMNLTQQYLGVLRDGLGHNQLTYHPEFRLDFTDSLRGKYEADIIALNTSQSRSLYVGQEAAHYPRLYYDYLSVWYRVVGSSDIITRIFVLRIGNSLIAVLTAIIVYRLGVILFASTQSAIVLTLLVMLQPMYSFLSAGINSDNLHNLIFAMVIYLGLRLVRSGPTLRLGAISVLVAALDILTKPQGYLAIPVIILALLVHIVAHKKWRLLLSFAVMALIGLAVIFGPGNRYKGWLMSSNIHGASVVEYLRFSLNQLVAQNIVWYWGVFKWLGVVLPSVYWQVANRLVLLSVAGLALYLSKVIRRIKVITPWPNVIFLLLASLVYASAIYYFDYQYVKSVGYSIGVQARYLFPTIASHMALLLIGILSLSRRGKVRTWLLRGVTVFIIWMQLGGLWRLLSSYYDLSSFTAFITQISQYKPFFAKGDFWYLWIIVYAISLCFLLYSAFKIQRKSS